jgi:hypothetical protein
VNYGMEAREVFVSLLCGTATLPTHSPTITHELWRVRRRIRPSNTLLSFCFCFYFLVAFGKITAYETALVSLIVLCYCCRAF